VYAGVLDCQDHQSPTPAGGWWDGGGMATTEVKAKTPPDTFVLVYFGLILLIVGGFMTAAANLAGLLVGGLGIAMLTVWMLRHYR
jgi:hypothetical protein